ncbi:MAG: hypothetical protein AMXMBFR34_47470 [Myxococcaceae bacterium]
MRSNARYLSPEPMLQSPTFATSMAARGMSVPTYAYAANNPLRYVDRDGLVFGPSAGGIGSAEPPKPPRVGPPEDIDPVEPPPPPDTSHCADECRKEFNKCMDPCSARPPGGRGRCAIRQQRCLSRCQTTGSPTPPLPAAPE